MNDISRIESLEELEALLDRSRQTPVWLFKHSLTCGISSAAWSEFRRFAEGQTGVPAAELAVVEIQRARPVSAAIAEVTGVPHESPQALLLSDGRALWSDSHWGVTADALARAQTAVLEPATRE